MPPAGQQGLPPGARPGPDQRGQDQPGPGQRGPDGRDQGRRGIGPGGAALGGAAIGAAGGFLAGQAMRRLDEVRDSRQESNEDGRTYIREPGRTIIRDKDRMFIRHDENERFRDLDRGRDLRQERRGDDFVTYFPRPNGEQIITLTDRNGRMLKRSRRFRDGREIIIIDNSFGPMGGPEYDTVLLPLPALTMPRERYILDADTADESQIYETLAAPPVAPLPRRYTLDQVRYSHDLRAHMRSVDLDTINFDTGSWAVTQDQAGQLANIAKALNQAISRNHNEVFLIEGYTDAVGSDVDNLSLSDRRAASVATILTEDFKVPPENLTTQGYGEEYLKVQTQEANRQNRRVTVRRITPLLSQGGQQ
jgi:outer membrane protein OmpA-like peptidoglycan-associated protein